MYKLVVSLVTFLVVFLIPDVAGSSSNNTCDPLSSGRIEANASEVQVTAPEGKLISGYCVKAGSVSQGLGPEYYKTVPIKSVSVRHSSGKDIGHYSLRYVDPT